MHPIIHRDLLEKIESYIQRKEFIAIVGPRQAGKTTFIDILGAHISKIASVHKRAIQKVTFEDRRLLQQFEKDPVLFTRSLFDPSIPAGGKKYLFIDEFQYARQGGQKLKLLYDTESSIKIFVTGSSSLDLRAQVGKFMVGRIFTFHLYPFSFHEYLRAKDSRLAGLYEEKNNQLLRWLRGTKAKESPHRGQDAFAGEINGHYEDYCTWGGYPEVVLTTAVDERRKVIASILNNYILKDIKGLLELATDRNLLLLAQYLATHIGRLVTYQNLGQACGLNYRSLKKHMQVLCETYVAREIRPFFRNRQKELSKNPKIYFLDMGFRNGLMENMSGFENRPDLGAIVENAVWIKLIDILEDAGKINFWRTKAGAEVDFVIEREGKITPVEVKFSSFPEARVPRSFVNFVDAFRPERGLILTKDFWGITRKNGCRILFAPACYL
ncbi:MAG: ATP-binding protein [Candidatus Omnitrophica bacterium]|nr:ATP-binding protein [Candidatus Omnitrophota bacterium]